MVKFDPRIPRKRGPLPWRYEMVDRPQFSTKQQLRVIAGGLLLIAIICGLYWVAHD